MKFRIEASYMINGTKFKFGCYTSYGSETTAIIQGGMKISLWYTKGDFWGHSRTNQFVGCFQRGRQGTGNKGVSQLGGFGGK